ncbi:MAG: hypothetical protein ABIY52_02315 [Gemmatimonadaceae bacterium]
MPHTLPPYALASPSFRFRHLANLAGRAPIGGAREVALACFVAARLAAESVGTLGEDPEARAARAVAARTWLGTLALPSAVKSPVLRCAELSGNGAAAVMGREVSGMAMAASNWLDAPSRAELEALATSLRA